MKNSALLVIDVQRAIFEGVDPVFKADELIANINRLADESRRRKVPVVYIQHESGGKFKRGSKGWQLHEGLKPKEDDLFIGKLKGNSFFETPLHERLGGLGVGRVIICGLLSQLCVTRTALGAIELGYETVLVSDAHSSSAMNPEREIAKADKTIGNAGASLVLTEDLLSSNEW